MSDLHSFASPAAFLGSFRVDEGVFDLGGRLSPGSIRDQVVRTRIVVQQIAEYGFLDKPSNTCIVGAGAAGMTAAIALCGLGSHDVLLVDQARLPLSLLAEAEQRLISPTLYDWPAEHHVALAYGGTPYYEEGAPSLVRNEWISVFRRLTNDGKLKWRSDTKAFPLKGPNVRFIDDKGVAYTESFDLVLLCKGYGQERGIQIKGSTDKLSPFAFWKPDPYPTIRGNTQPSFKGQVVVLGGGDGAIQDMLRFVTSGRDARYLLNAITSAIPSVNLREIWGLMENEIRCRRLAGGTPSARLLKDVEKRIDDLTSSPRLAAMLDNLIRFADVGVYFHGEVLGPCYPLNQFLAFLFQAHVKRTRSRELLYPEHTVMAVECACGTDDHFDKPHTVLFAPNAGEIAGKQVTCQVVVPRLGVDEETLPIRRRLLSHDLPYWLGDWKPVSKQ